jgi:glutamate dehydrogenase (NAD(P)+)
LEGARVVIQGFGRVGTVLAELLAQAGASVIGIADDREAVANARGIDIGKAVAWVHKRDSVEGLADADALARDELFGLDCDILVSAGVQNQIGLELADTVKAGIIAEAANSPITHEADLALHDRGVLVIPDILCTAGGLVLGYFEWVQDMQAFFWSEAEIAAQQTRIMDDAFAGVLEMSEARKVNLRGAAMMVAVERVAEATQRRGLYP